MKACLCRLPDKKPLSWQERPGEEVLGDLLSRGIRNIARMESPQGRYIKGKRQSAVEAVFGTLTQFMGLRKVNTIGLAQANKVMHLSAIAYNTSICPVQA